VGCLLGEEDPVDDVENTIVGLDVGRGDHGVIHPGLAIGHLDLKIGSLKGLEGRSSLHFLARVLAVDNVKLKSEVLKRQKV
jgi:hypothetical protein